MQHLRYGTRWGQRIWRERDIRIQKGISRADNYRNQRRPVGDLEDN